MGEVDSIIDVISRHLPLFAACTVVDGVVDIVGWWGLRAGGKWGLDKEKRRTSGVKAALLIHPKMLGNSVVRYKQPSTKISKGRR